MSQKEHQLPSDKKRKRLIRIQSKTNPNYGKNPKENTVSELLNNGFFIVDKTSGPTSHQIVAWVKDILNIQKAGHAGTLDPRVTGVLPIAVGNGTRALQMLLSAGKEYVALMKLHKPVEENKIREVCNGFVGEISQIPPLRSAVKRVRRKRHIYYLDVLEIKESEVLFQVGCEAGTYIRTLCVDIGKKLKTGAHLAELRRTRVGKITEEHATSLHNIKDAFVTWIEEKDDSELRNYLFPIEKLLDSIPIIVIRDSAVDALCHGAELAIPGVVEIDTDIKKGDIVGVLTLKGEGVAIVKMHMATEEIIQKDHGICATLERVLMNKGTYPAIWKKP